MALGTNFDVDETCLIDCDSISSRNKETFTRLTARFCRSDPKCRLGVPQEDAGNEGHIWFAQNSITFTDGADGFRCLQENEMQSHWEGGEGDIIEEDSKFPSLYIRGSRLVKTSWLYKWDCWRSCEQWTKYSRIKSNKAMSSVSLSTCSNERKWQNCLHAGWCNQNYLSGDVRGKRIPKCAGGVYTRPIITW